MLKYKEFIKSQIKSVNESGLVTSFSKKHLLGGMMNDEEVRMNRALLQEIARRKKQLKAGSLGS